MEFTKEYFIEKFEAIPEEDWGRMRLFNPETGKRCALGFCGARNIGDFYLPDRVPEAHALYLLFREHGMHVGDVNNSGDSPKRSVLNALKSF